MLARQRHDLIVESIQLHGSVRVRDLAAQFDVSEMTIRRDLDHLASKQLVEKVHGGATRLGNLSSFEPGFSNKQRRQRAEKEAIAERALSMVRPGSTIAISAGTTTWAFAKRLHAIADLTVVTNAPAVADALYRSPRADVNVLLTGGARTPSDALVGPIAIESLSRLHVDTVFMGVHGMDATLGYSTPNLAEADVNNALIRTATRFVVLADHTKWGMLGLARIAPLARADLVISDCGLPLMAREHFESIETDLELVPIP